MTTADRSTFHTVEIDIVPDEDVIVGGLIERVTTGDSETFIVRRSDYLTTRDALMGLMEAIADRYAEIEREEP